MAEKDNDELLQEFMEVFVKNVTDLKSQYIHTILFVAQELGANTDWSDHQTKLGTIITVGAMIKSLHDLSKTIIVEENPEIMAQLKAYHALIKD